MLESYCDDCDDCDGCDNDDCDCDPEVAEVDISKEELLGLKRGDTEVVHVLYPAEETYHLVGEWVNRIEEEYENVDMKYSKGLDAFIFFCGKFEDAECIANDILHEKAE